MAKQFLIVGVCLLVCLANSLHLASPSLLHLASELDALTAMQKQFQNQTEGIIEQINKVQKQTDASNTSSTTDEKILVL
jgi:ABC-type molybdate transport system substrate-binding protein